ncbi:hypothetical protein [Lacunimicrobium album]
MAKRFLTPAQIKAYLPQFTRTHLKYWTDKGLIATQTRSVANNGNEFKLYCLEDSRRVWNAMVTLNPDLKE